MLYEVDFMDHFVIDLYSWFNYQNDQHELIQPLDKDEFLLILIWKIPNVHLFYFLGVWVKRRNGLRNKKLIDMINDMMRKEEKNKKKTKVKMR